MKLLITDADKVRINRARCDAMKLLGAFEAKDRKNAMKIIDFMENQWTNAIRQSNTTVNLDLANSRGLSDESINRIQELHRYRKRHIVQLKNEEIYTTNTVGHAVQKHRIAEHLAWLRDIEYELQSIWGFDLDSSYHEYNLPHCTCPNNEKGNPFRRVNRDCVLHNTEMKELVSEFFAKIEKQYDTTGIEK